MKSGIINLSAKADKLKGMKMIKIVSIMLALALVVGFGQGISNAQVGRGFDFKYASDYNAWSARANNDVAVGAASVTVRGDASFTTNAGETFMPFFSGNKLLFDGGGANPETLAISAPSSCTINGLSSTCTFTATFVYAHTAGFTIQTGTGGLMEAINQIPAAGGTAVVSNASAASTTTITTTVSNGAAAKLVLNVRNGDNTTYKYSADATAYVALPSTGSGRLLGLKGADVVSGSCTSGDCTLPAVGGFFVVTGTTTVDGFSTAGVTAGTMIVVQTSGSITFTDNGTVAAGFGAMKLVGAGNVSMTANDNIMLMWTGSFWDQIAPTLVK